MAARITWVQVWMNLNKYYQTTGYRSKITNFHNKYTQLYTSLKTYSIQRTSVNVISY